MIIIGEKINGSIPSRATGTPLYACGGGLVVDYALNIGVY
jgi:hypothetical protein